MSDRMRAAEGQDGWIGGQLLKPLDQPATRVIVGTWESRAQWEDWHNEEAFRTTRERLEGLQAGPADVAWHEAVLDWLDQWTKGAKKPTVAPLAKDAP